MDLKNDIGYVVFCYSDNSHKYFRTSLSPDILSDYEGYLKEGYLYDIDRKIFVKLPTEDSGVTLEIVKDINDSKEVTEIDRYFHRFI